jgi:hypothetical protein
MLVGGGVPAVAAGGICALGALWWGPSTALAVGVGVVTGLVAMALPALVLAVAGRWHPGVAAVAGLSVFSAVVLGILQVREWAVGQSPLESPWAPPAVGVGLAVTVVLWSFGLMRAVRAARLPIWDPPAP